MARPRSGYYETLSTQAAALMQSLPRNHAFVDGNKRMAFALTAVFLRLNGYRLQVTADRSFSKRPVVRLHRGQADMGPKLKTFSKPAHRSLARAAWLTRSMTPSQSRA